MAARPAHLPAPPRRIGRRAPATRWSGHHHRCRNDAQKLHFLLRGWRRAQPVAGLRSVMVCPETERAVHTMPASAITKNMPVVPESPNRSRTTEEIMMVSMVIPDTGFRAVVAMALAATMRKEREHQRQREACEDHRGRTERFARKAATAMALAITPIRMAITECRGRCVLPVFRRAGKPAWRCQTIRPQCAWISESRKSPP